MAVPPAGAAWATPRLPTMPNAAATTTTAKALSRSLQLIFAIINLLLEMCWVEVSSSFLCLSPAYRIAPTFKGRHLLPLPRPPLEGNLTFQDRLVKREAGYVEHKPGPRASTVGGSREGYIRACAQARDGGGAYKDSSFAIHLG